MNFGKREQIVGISIAALATIGIVHLLVFAPRAKQYGEVLAEYKDGVSRLADAKRWPTEQYFKNEVDRVKQHEKKVDDFVQKLNLDQPDFFKNRGPADTEKRFEQTIGLLKELQTLRADTKVPQLTFLNDLTNQRDPRRRQQGWNFPPTLQVTGPAGATWDAVVKLRDSYNIIGNYADPSRKLLERLTYQQYLLQLRINPVETSEWVSAVNTARGPQFVYFSDPELQKALSASTGLRVDANPDSINRFGPAVPMLKKLWMAELLWAQRDANSDIKKSDLRNILEVGLPSGQTLLQVNKQLAALIDIIKMARTNNVSNIYQVRLLRPTNFGKGFNRKDKPEAAAGGTPAPGQPGAEPAANAAFGGTGEAFAGRGLAGMGASAGVDVFGPQGDKRLGVGAGIELWFVGSNSNIMEFMFDVTNTPRMYAVDDLNMIAQASGELITSTTIELVTSLDKLK
jgi:hypothetical protein